MDTAAILERALRFARTLRFTIPRVVRSNVARDEFVSRYGTPGSTDYLEVEIHMDFASNSFDDPILKTDTEDAKNIRELMNGGMDLLVVCSSTDVIHHAFPNVDLN